MPDLEPVEHDPFLTTPVDHNPFATPIDPATLPTYQDPISRGIGTALIHSAADVGQPFLDMARAQSPGQFFAGAGSAMLAMAAPMGAKGAARLGVNALEELSGPAASEAGNALKTGIRAFHGSPYDFEKFDLSKIGTGEGAQAYGHGLYFAENEDAARQYRDALAPSRGKLPDDMISMPPELRQALMTHAATDADPLTAAKRAQNMAAPLRSDDTEKLADMITRARESRRGKMYEVSINADPEHFLDLEKPLNEQPPAVQKLVAQTGAEILPQFHGDKGYSVYKALENHFVRQAVGSRDIMDVHPAEVNGLVSQAVGEMSKAGIPGIKYLDQGSRGTGEGTHNYVVFDDKLIDIMKKYGIAGLSALPAAGAAHFSTTAIDHDPFAATQ